MLLRGYILIFFLLLSVFSYAQTITENLQGTWINDKDSTLRIEIKNNGWTYVDLKKKPKKQKTVYYFHAEENKTYKGQRGTTSDYVILYGEKDTIEYWGSISGGDKFWIADDKTDVNVFYTSAKYLEYMRITDPDRKLVQDVCRKMMDVFKTKNATHKILDFIPAKDILLKSHPAEDTSTLSVLNNRLMIDTVYQRYFTDSVIAMTNRIIAEGISEGFLWSSSRLNEPTVVNFPEVYGVPENYTIENAFPLLWINDDNSESFLVNCQMIKLFGNWYLAPVIYSFR